MQNRKSIKEAFPFIRQMISDVYGMDVHFFGESYQTPSLKFHREYFR